MSQISGDTDNDKDETSSDESDNGSRVVYESPRSSKSGSSPSSPKPNATDQRTTPAQTPASSSDGIQGTAFRLHTENSSNEWIQVSDRVVKT